MDDVGGNKDQGNKKAPPSKSNDALSSNTNSSTPQSLANIEQDILEKQNAGRGRTAESSPGAVAAASSGPLSTASASLSQHDAAAKTQGGVKKAPNPSAASSLTQMEMDIVAKTQARSGAPHSSKPGAVAIGATKVPASDASSLSQMERDVLAKTQGSAVSAATTPGAASIAGGGELSQLERDVMAKTQGRSVTRATAPGAAGHVDASQLSQMERDVMAKTQGRSVARATSPGAVAAGQDGASQPSQLVAGKTEGRSAARATAPAAVAAGQDDASQLSQLERDVMAKTQGRSVSRATAPGALAASEDDASQLSQLGRDPGAVANGRGAAAADLSQVERDVMAIMQGRSGAPAMTPGVVSAYGDGASSLSQVEQDIVTKTQVRSAVAATKPGAVASLAQMERDVVTKTQGRANAPASVPRIGGTYALSQLEQDAVAKTQGRSGPPAAIPGAMASSSPHSSQLKEDTMAKTQGRSAPALGPGAVASTPRSSTGLSQMEQDVIAKTQRLGLASTASPGVMVGGANDSLSQLEQDLMAKSQAPGGGLMVGAACTAFAAVGLSQMEQDTLAKTQGADPSQFMGGGGASLYQMEADLAAKSQITGQSDPYQGGSQVPAMREFENDILNKNPPQSHQYRNGVAIGIPEGRPADEAPPESAPDRAGTSYDAEAMVDEPIENGGAIQAFVCEDGEVVDATGVAVLLSEDEEMEIARKKYRRYKIGTICAVVMLIVIIVVVIVLVSGGEDTPAPSVTEAPTEAPTAAPTIQATGADVPETAACLSSLFGDASNFEDRTSPQSKALIWISDGDEFIESDSLGCTDERFIVRYVLATLYFAMNGDNWDNCGRSDPECAGTDERGWLSDADVCDWLNVVCNETTVVGLDFGSNDKLSYDDVLWEFPPEFSYLKNISILRMVDMDITGSIGKFFDLWSNLEIFDLSANKLNGQLPNFTASSHRSLREILLNSNGFNGPIPTGYSSLGSLTSLVLSGNNLNGTAPEGIFLPKLRVLHLTGNSELMGTLPPQLGNMTVLDELNLAKTQFGGELPVELYTLVSLRILNLEGCKFSGSISSEIGLMEGLVQLDLRNNEFSGQIPNVWSQIPGLEGLFLDGNPDLSGEITYDDCSARGADVGQIQTLSVDCDITCYEDCCNHPQECP